MKYYANNEMALLKIEYEVKFAGTSSVFLSALKTIEVPEGDFWWFFGELWEQVC